MRAVVETREELRGEPRVAVRAERAHAASLGGAQLDKGQVCGQRRLELGEAARISMV